MKTRTKAKKAPLGRAARKRPTVGERIIEGLEQAVAWTRRENNGKNSGKIQLVRNTY